MTNISPLALTRNTWRTLTSMGTALVLLFLLALAAIPGALLPQRNLNEAKVADNEQSELLALLAPMKSEIVAGKKK